LQSLQIIDKDLVVIMVKQLLHIDIMKRLCNYAILKLIKIKVIKEHHTAAQVDITIITGTKCLMKK